MRSGLQGRGIGGLCRRVVCLCGQVWAFVREMSGLSRGEERRGAVGAIASDDCMAEAENVVRVTEGEAQDAVVRDGRGKGKDGELGVIHLGFKSDV